MPNEMNAWSAWVVILCTSGILMITMGIRQTTGLLAALAALVNLPIREDKVSVGDRSEFASDGCRAAAPP